VQLGGRAGAVTHPGRRGALLENVVAPLLRRYGRHPAVWAWDAVNEPEWAQVPRPDLRALIADLVAAVRRHTEHRVTVGLVGPRGLDLVRGLDLDFFQMHWYDSVQDQVPLEGGVSALRLERPLLLGEFPTVGSRRPPQAIVRAARRAGYAGALAWSLLASDSASRPSESGPLIAALAREFGDPSTRQA
jgi:hypothetical protein